MLMREFPLLEASVQKLFRFLLISACAVLVPLAAWAETISQSFEHKLGMNQAAQLDNFLLIVGNITYARHTASLPVGNRH